MACRPPVPPSWVGKIVARAGAGRGQEAKWEIPEYEAKNKSLFFR
jgi:hypothetical protein